jgi:cyclophilin family peptidyl-prolyl cis-trans isomerase
LRRQLPLLAVFVCALLPLSCKTNDRLPTALLLDPDAPEMNQRAPDLFHVRLETSKGELLIEVHRDWSPHGVDRFYNLVRAGYYDDNRFFRIRTGYWAQFGINGDPKISNAWRTRTIPDDPRVESNTRGTIAFAFAVPNGRTTQIFINLRDNSSTHDREPFVPFGRIIEGMAVADVLNFEYGESAGGGIRGGKQAPLFEQGNEYLRENFPRLDYIRRATVERVGQAFVPAGSPGFLARCSERRLESRRNQQTGMSAPRESSSALRPVAWQAYLHADTESQATSPIHSTQTKDKS